MRKKLWRIFLIFRVVSFAVVLTASCGPALTPAPIVPTAPPPAGATVVSVEPTQELTPFPEGQPTPNIPSGGPTIVAVGEAQHLASAGQEVIYFEQAPERWMEPQFQIAGENVLWANPEQGIELVQPYDSDGVGGRIFLRYNGEKIWAEEFWWNSSTSRWEAEYHLGVVVFVFGFADVLGAEELLLPNEIQLISSTVGKG